MFCLRSWMAITLFLTNASPLYVFLFITATYVLQRPCVYCSILLFVLVLSLFDFSANWFEPRWQSSKSISESASWLLSGNATLTEALAEIPSLALSALNETSGSVASAVLDSARKRLSNGNYSGSATASGFEWFRNLLEKRQFRIPCVDVLVRL